MASRDPLADGNDIAFDLMAQEQDGPGSQVMRAMSPEMEPVDQYLMQRGLLGAPDLGPMNGLALASAAMLSLGDLVANMRMDAIDARWAQDENTLLNFAFKNGHHYIEADKARRGVVALPAPRTHTRRSVHKFQPWYQHQHGQLSSAAPQSGVAPSNGGQQEDRDAAQYATALRDWLMPSIYSFQQRSANAMWMMLGGVCTAYVGVKWADDPEYTQITGMRKRPDIDVKYHSPMEIWNNNTASTVKELPWIGRDLFMREADARALYVSDDRADLLMTEAELTDPNEHGYWTLRQVQTFLAMADPWGVPAGPAVARRAMEEQDVICPEFFGRAGLVLQGAYLDGLAMLQQAQGVPLTVEVLSGETSGAMPLVRFPRGVRILFTPEGRILEVSDADWPGEGLPFREFKSSQSAGYWSPAWATFMREINQALDWAFSLREEHLLKTAIPPFLEPKEARISRRQSLSGASVRVRYRANRFGAKPEWADPPQMPADIIQFLGQLNELWMEIGGRREVSQGTLPARLSGVAVSLLQEADAAQLGFAGNELEEGHGDVLAMALRTVQDYFPENDPRLVKLAGDAPFKLQAFMRADIEHDLDIRIQKGSGVPRSASVTRQTALELFQIGALVDPVTHLPDYRRLLRIFEFGSDDELYGEQQLDEQNSRNAEDMILQLDPLMAQRLIEVFQKTEQLPAPFAPAPYDNLVVHERSTRLRLKQIESDQRIPQPNRALLQLRWTVTVMGALPLLAQADPAVAAMFIPPPQPQAQGGQDQQGGGQPAKKQAS